MIIQHKSFNVEAAVIASSQLGNREGVLVLELREPRQLKDHQKEAILNSVHLPGATVIVTCGIVVTCPKCNSTEITDTEKRGRCNDCEYTFELPEDIEIK